MRRLPYISIVTPSFNQGHYIAETIESVLAQNYPQLEHIVVDGGSSDNTLEVLRRYPHLKVISEPDRGQADAINKGFRMASGEVLGFLNSDDTLLPDALNRVAQEIDPKTGLHIVMGRCHFTDENGRLVGVEHPSYFENHRRMLAIWKGHGIPQPSVFWSREVWNTCGQMDENLGYSWIDYDLFCRFSLRYRFHFVNQVFSTYRLQPESKTMQQSDADRLKECIEISRRYWGSIFSPKYWQLAMSLLTFRANRTGRALALIREAQEAQRCGQKIRMTSRALAGTMLGPEVAFYALVCPYLRKRLGSRVNSLVRNDNLTSQSLSHLDRTSPWNDGWVGPHLIVSQKAAGGESRILLQGSADNTYLSEPLIIKIYVDGRQNGQCCIEDAGDFAHYFSLDRPLTGGGHKIEVRANTWWVPHQFLKNGDHRLLSFRLSRVAFEN